MSDGEGDRWRDEEFEIPVVETDLFEGSAGGAELRKTAYRVQQSDDADADNNAEELLRGVRIADAAVRADATRLTRHAVFDALFRAAAAFGAGTLGCDGRKALADAACAAVAAVARRVQAHPALHAADSSLQSSSQQQQLRHHHMSQQSSSQQQQAALLSAAEAATLRNALKMAVFLLAWVVKLAERDAAENPPMTAAALPPKTPSRAKRGRTKDAAAAAAESGAPTAYWTDETRERALSSLLEALETEGLALLWRAPRPEEGFVALFTRTAFLVLESPANARNKTLRRCVALMVGTLVKAHAQGVAVTATAVHMLHSNEHLPAPLAEVYATVATEFDGTHAVGSIIREIAKLEPAELSREATLARNVAVFISELAERLPRVVLPAVSVLLPHLRGGESHVVRNGIVQALGILALKAFDGTGGGSGEDERVGADMATRDSLLGVLEERFRDVSSYARSKALQTWIPLVKARAVPLVRLRSVTEMAVERLDDKAAQVRRSAVQLLTVLLQFNPFSPRLSLSSFRQKRALCDSVFEEIEQNPSGEEGDEENGASSVLAADGNDEAEALKTIDKRRFAELFAGTPFEREWTGKGSASALLHELRRFHRWAKDGAEFAEAMGKTVSHVVELLVSRSTTDTTEAMEFVVAAEQFAVEGAMVGVRRMLHLAWAKEAPVRDALVESFTALVFSRPRVRDVAEALVGLALDASSAEAVSMEELVWLASEKGRLAPAIVTALVDIIQQQSAPSAENKRRRAAMLVLGMIASANPLLVAGTIGLIVEAALGPEWTKDTTLAMRACEVLQRLRRDDPQQQQGATAQTPEPSTKEEEDDGEDEEEEEEEEAAEDDGEKKKKKKGNRRKKRKTPSKKDGEGETEAPIAADEPIRGRGRNETRRPRPAGIGRLSNKHELFTRLCAVILEQGDGQLQPVYAAWAPVAEQSMNAIALLAENPDHIFEGIISRLHKAAFAAAGGAVSSERLSRLLFVVGHAAIKMLAHIEVVAKHMESALLQKHAAAKIKSEADAAAKAKKTKKHGRKGGSASASAATTGVDEGEGEGAGIAVEASEAEAAQMAAERELVDPGRMLGSYVPLVCAVCANTGGGFNNTNLRAAAVVALGKLTVAGGAEFCEAKISLLVTVLETAPEPELRATVVAALGDLCARFPNTAEPWTSHIYSKLRDTDARVRRNAAAVLSHLVLNDMIKLKGHVAALALALEDEDDRVRELARLFFTELAKKGNAVYNVLPDAISSLSAMCSTAASKDSDKQQQQKGPQPVTWEAFRKIVRFLFGFLQKERQFEALLEKLCARFRTTEDARAIAFCLTQLTLNERCVRKLIDLYPSYQEKLHDDDVFDSFNAVVSRARKFARPEMKAAADDLERKIASSRSVQQSGESASQMLADEVGEAALSAPAAPVTPAPSTRGKKREATTTTQRKRKTTTAKTPAKKGRKKKAESSDEEEEEMPSLPSDSDESSEDDDGGKKKKKHQSTKKKPTPKGRKAAAAAGTKKASTAQKKKKRPSTSSESSSDSDDDEE